MASLGGDGGTRRERLARIFAALHERGVRQARRLWDGLSAIRGARVYGPPPPASRTPTVSVTLKGRTAEEMARSLVDSAIFASHGDFYAQTVIERLGVEALLRLGCACYTTDEEVERVIEGVDRIASASNS
jgi:selenocysteine lyase/cysteine desulfurase